MADVYAISIREPGGYDKLALTRLAAPTRGSNLRTASTGEGATQYFSEVISWPCRYCACFMCHIIHFFIVKFFDP